MKTNRIPKVILNSKSDNKKIDKSKTKWFTDVKNDLKGT